jgi:hypothetical protein
MSRRTPLLPNFICMRPMNIGVADYRQLRGEDIIAAEFAERGYAHSNLAAEFSRKAFRPKPVAERDQRAAQILARLA